MKNIVAAVDFSNATPGVTRFCRGNLPRHSGRPCMCSTCWNRSPSYTAYGFTPDEFPAIHLFQEEARKRATARLDEMLKQVSSDVTGAKVHLAEEAPSMPCWTT